MRFFAAFLNKIIIPSGFGICIVFVSFDFTYNDFKILLTLKI